MRRRILVLSLYSALTSMPSFASSDAFLSAVQARAPIDIHLMRSIRANGMGAILYQDEDVPSFTADYKVEPGKHNDQGSSGRCWIFAGEKLIAEKAREKWGKDFTFSHNYIAFWDKYERAQYYLDKVESYTKFDAGTPRYDALNRLLGDGGEWELFRNIVKKYGVVPKSAMKETKFSAHSGGYSAMIKETLIQYGSEIHKLARKRVKLVDQALIEAVNSEIAGLRLDAMVEVYRILEIYLGNPPETVTVEGKNQNKTMTPQEYATYAEVDMDSYVYLLNVGYHPEGKKIIVTDVGNLSDGETVKGYTVSTDAIRNVVLTSLRAGNGLMTTSEMVGHDVDRNYISLTVDLTDAILGFNSAFRAKHSKGDRLKYGMNSVAHGMYLNGCSLSEGVDKEKAQGKDVRAWLVQNTWSSSDHIWIESNWFDLYGYGVVAQKKHLSPELAQMIEKAEDLVVPPWDPLGKITLN